MYVRLRAKLVEVLTQTLHVSIYVDSLTVLSESERTFIFQDAFPPLSSFVRFIEEKVAVYLQP